MGVNKDKVKAVQQIQILLMKKKIFLFHYEMRIDKMIHFTGVYININIKIDWIIKTTINTHLHLHITFLKLIISQTKRFALGLSAL